MVRYQSQSLKSISIKFKELLFSCLVAEMNSTVGIASIAKNCYEKENDDCTKCNKNDHGKKNVLIKGRTFDYLTESLASKIEIELSEHVLAALIESNLMIKNSDWIKLFSHS